MKMTTMRRTVRTGVAALVAVSLTLVMALTAFAAVTSSQVTGIDTSIVQGDTRTNLVVINKGNNETVYVDVFDEKGEMVALRLSYKLDKDTGALCIENLQPANAKGYTFAIYDDQKAADPIYFGTVYPVYAQLGDDAANLELIGIRTLQAGETRNYYPEESLYFNNTTYVLEHGADGSAVIVPGPEGSLVFKYKVPASVSATGTITYIDQDTGKAVLTTQYMGIETGGTLSVKVPAGIVGDDKNTYRTIYYYDSVKFMNPDRLSVSVPVSKRNAPSEISPDYYTATVKLVDGSGASIAQDQVSVMGDFNYAVPETVYQQTDSIDPTQMYREYRLADTQEAYVQNGIINMKPGETRSEFIVKYVLQDTSKDQTVTYNLIDASQKTTIDGKPNPARVVGTVTQIATASAPEVKPEATIKNSKGEELYLAGDIAQYTYTFGSGASPIINVYYMPKGYNPPKEYKVTVNYVNLADNSKLKSETLKLNVKDNPSLETSNYAIEFPNGFTQDGEQYVLINGQVSPIQHNYYSGDTTYTIYYRNIKDNLSEDVIINRINVVYNDIITGGGTAPLANTASLNAINSSAGGVITNNAGTDVDTVRIGDDATPLAQGSDNQFSFEKDWPLVLGSIAIVVVAGFIIATLLRKRKESESAE